MKLWITKNSEVPVRSQIVAQIRVGIASGDLKTGEKLPSTREISRRFGVHANTVSAAYRELAASGEVEFKKGSGIYVRTNGYDPLDLMLDRFFGEAARAGFSREEVLARISNGDSAHGVECFALFEPNSALAEIAAAEVSAATGIRVVEADPKEGLPAERCQLIAMFDEEKNIRSLFGETKCIYLKANSVAGSMKGRTRPDGHELIAVASGWSDFLVLARLYLLAAKVDPASITICPTDRRGWKRSLSAASMIVCDTVTAERLGNDDRVNRFPVVAASSLDELRQCASGRNVAPA